MTHNNRTIYADYQATTPVDPRVVERMAPHWHASFGNPHSSDHIVGWQAAKAVTHSKTTVAELIGADPDEIIFTSGATEANNLALFGLARRAADNSTTYPGRRNGAQVRLGGGAGAGEARGLHSGVHHG